MDLDAHDAAATSRAQADAYLSRNVAGWGRAGDLGVIAEQGGARASGVGTAMLTKLITAARARYPALVLSVRATNPAVRLYQRLGFETVRKIANRAGTTSLEMRLELAHPQRASP